VLPIGNAKGAPHLGQNFVDMPELPQFVQIILISFHKME
jgi:hypothetical protein